MASSSRLMVIVDSALQVTPALWRAAALARKSGDGLLLALFEYDYSLAGAIRQGIDLDNYLDTRRQKLEAFAASLRSDGLKVDTRLFWGRPRLVRLLRAILKEQPRMVFRDVHTEAVLKRLLPTPTDLDLFRQCPAPLMLVGSTSNALPRRIVAAVDPLDEHNRPEGLNERVLEAAQELAGYCKAQLDVVHVFENATALSNSVAVATGWIPDAKLQEKLRATHRDALNALGREFSVPAANLHMLEGPAAEAIADFTRDKFTDVIVMGTVQRNFLERLAIGSVAEGLLQRLDCDILAIKPDGFAEHMRSDLERIAPSTATASA